eukprot:CAMPEP_0201495564 /NCGR_PEP_ID=MMETSP0151_2-20130828/54684_1 /ASSEMBLY_ACC=CAM_ASM_000257 /TAXON_ID=200890 /ORGANISM="Paramoeba atlantica, Strain 621/1 / CCAP 1560/9" /LENGTH=77 /DNA_ID=CAMNT_0047884679 /DNA_START=1 /DNA_END=231 /DNA_ORIENTATION=-
MSSTRQQRNRKVNLDTDGEVRRRSQAAVSLGKKSPSAEVDYSYSEITGQTIAQDFDLLNKSRPFGVRTGYQFLEEIW